MESSVRPIQWENRVMNPRVARLASAHPDEPAGVGRALMGVCIAEGRPERLWEQVRGRWEPGPHRRANDKAQAVVCKLCEQGPAPFAEPHVFSELGCVPVGDPNALPAQLPADADCGVAWLEALEPTRRASRSGAATNTPRPRRHSRLSRCKHYCRCFRLLPGDGSSSAQRWSPPSRPRSASRQRAFEAAQLLPRSQA